MQHTLKKVGLSNVVLSESGNSTSQSTPLPGDLLGNNGKPGGKRINTDLPGINPTPDELFDKLTGGKSKTLPDGTKVGDNWFDCDLIGPRIDIPSNGSKPHETIHFPSRS